MEKVVLASINGASGLKQVYKLNIQVQLVLASINGASGLKPRLFRAVRTRPSSSLYKRG